MGNATEFTRGREQGVVRRFREQITRRHDLERYETIVETVSDGVYVLDRDLRFSFVNERLCEMTGRSREELIGTPVTALFSNDDEADAADEIRRRVVNGESDVGTVQATVPTADGERILEARYRLHPEPDGEYRGSVGIVRDVTDREERERALERQRDELETLDRIADLLLAITRDLFGSATRSEIEETICDRLAASDLYRFAWIGAPGADGRRIVPRATAGIDEGYVEAATITTGDADTGRGPGGRAFRTGEVQVSHDVRTDPTFEPWRDAALERGIRSAAAVPLVCGETTYGILAVYAARPFAFTRRERAGFETLGEAAGFAIDAIEERKLLFADSIVELEFEIDDPGLVFVRASERLECELTVRGAVASTDGAWSCYLAVDGADPTAVRNVATEDPGVDEIRILADEASSGLLEFVMEDPLLNEGTGHGAVLTSGRVDDGQGRFSVEVPRTADVRRVADRLRAAYPESTLIAQREFDRPARSAGELRSSIGDRLTDRQREALTRAHHAGYFAWPRRSTAGDVAASMDVAETTFHYHLRNGLDTLVAALMGFEE